MIVNMDREKLINTIIFFSESTRNCSKVKLFKLLFLLDFEHFKATGRTVTGSDYFALPLGPVPLALHDEFDNDPPARDFADSVEIKEDEFFGYRRFLVKPRKPFDSNIFSKRELKLLNSLAEQYRFQTATEMVDVTHAENSAWDRIWNEGKGIGDKIPYEFSLANEEESFTMSKVKQERDDFISHFSSQKFNIAA